MSRVLSYYHPLMIWGLPELAHEIVLLNNEYSPCFVCFCLALAWFKSFCSVVQQNAYLSFFCPRLIQQVGLFSFVIATIDFCSLFGCPLVGNESSNHVYCIYLHSLSLTGSASNS